MKTRLFFKRHFKPGLANARRLIALAMIATATAFAGASDGEIAVRQPDQPLALSAPVRHSLIESDTFHFELAIDPTSSQWMFNGDTDQKTLSQRLGLVYRFDPTDFLAVRYEAGAGFLRNDIIVLEDIDPTVNLSEAFSQKASVAIHSAKEAALNAFVQTQARFVDEQAGVEETTAYGSDVVLTPFKPTTLRAQATYAEKLGFDQTLVFQNIYGASLVQKIPTTPFTLRAAESFTSDRPELDSVQETNTWKSEGSVLWEIRPKTTWAAGFQYQETQLSDFAAITEGCFTQFDMQTTELTSISMRAGYETHERTDATVAPDPKVSLSLGIKLKIVPTLDAGFGVKYQFPQASPAATPVSSTIFSLSATGFF